MKSLYIHIPFCRSKCFYCSFAVSVGQEHRARMYVDALAKESGVYKKEKISTVYLGGGTPTMLETKELTAVLEMVRETFEIVPDVEWSVEANPEDVTAEKLATLKSAGVNRISLGIQSFNDRYLKYLGRNHDAKTAVGSYERTRESGFENVNLDLMFSFPGQGVEEIKSDVESAVSLNSEHLSLYTLTVEERSRFFAKQIQLDDGPSQAAQYELVCDLLQGAGFEQYEISNFAKDSKYSRHNLNYWQGGEYIGLGVAAHSHIGQRRFWNVSKLNPYLSALKNGDSAEEGSETLNPLEKMKEVVLFGLRMNRGVSVAETEKRFGCSFRQEEKDNLQRFIKEGFLVLEGGFLKATPQGRVVLDELCARLI